MKKIFSIITLLVLIGSMFINQWVNAVDNNKTFNVSSFTDSQWNFPLFSPDWKSVVYQNNKDKKLYKKTIGEKWDWTVFVSERTAVSKVFDSNWTYLVYQNEWYDLYKKDLSWNWGSVQITSIWWAYWPTLTPDWKTILYYSAWENNQIYIKGINDQWNWKKFSILWGYIKSISKDW